MTSDEYERWMAGPFYGHERWMTPAFFVALAALIALACLA
jgi:hypothetical protein